MNLSLDLPAFPAKILGYSDAQLATRRAAAMRRARSLSVHPAVLLFPGWRTEDESAAQ
jgi:hypothetical protein